MKKFDNYPIYITRDLEKAKQFVRSNALRKERFGKLCSSNSRILGKNDGAFKIIDNYFFPKWMLDEAGNDSSNSLILAASEFNIQGLEIDWSLLGWDMDMYYLNGNWHEQRMLTPSRFVESTEIQKKHILNAYRVLLTRARKGMIIYIPKRGDYEDKYNVSQYYDSTYDYLKSCGIKDIDDVNNVSTRINKAVVLPF